MRCVKIKGLSWHSTENDIKDFFKDFGVKRIVIDKHMGKTTGYALAIMEKEEEALRAIKDLNKKYIGDRWVFLTTPFVQREYTQKPRQFDRYKAPQGGAATNPNMNYGDDN